MAERIDEVPNFGSGGMVVLLYAQFPHSGTTIFVFFDQLPHYLLNGVKVVTQLFCQSQFPPTHWHNASYICNCSVSDSTLVPRLQYHRRLLLSQFRVA